MTTKTTKTAFGRYIVTLPMSCITAQREPPASTKNMACYKRIASSLEHIGLIEPLVVFEQTKGSFLLVDGNTRFSILKSKGTTEVPCIVAMDDEAYTYNRRVSHVPPIPSISCYCACLKMGFPKIASPPRSMWISER